MFELLKGSQEIVNLLTTAGASLELQDKDNHNALHFATMTR
jgi:ankyrin repeat protein